MRKDYKALLEEAKTVLKGNWVGHYTRPSPALYPHQWNWDSGFIAIGYSHYNQRKAEEELRSLLNAQWKNGMVPQIVFNQEALGGYFPEPDFWQAERSPEFPSNILTSGITMPPIHATAAWMIYKNGDDKREAEGFLREIFPKLKMSHEYFYKHRNPDGNGLVYIRHPWESGFDNSPAWDIPLRGINIDKSKLPLYERRDIKKGISKEERPTDEDYDRYIYLVDLFRNNDYDEAAIYESCPFLVQDVAFNSILCNADQSLMQIGELIGEDISDVMEWESKTRTAINKKLWSREDHVYYDYDLYNRSLTGKNTATDFLPLFAGVPSEEQAGFIFASLDSVNFCEMHNNKCFSVPSYDLKSHYVDTKNYWRGPVWINLNWMLYHGLKRYGFLEKAMAVRQDILELTAMYGFHEYFEPYKGRGRGYGTDNFSWTAALFIDMMFENGFLRY
ncbi:MAG: trehalase family glycosidase [Nitrospirota bacterium]